MRSKTDFYRLFFEQLTRKGFDVKRSQSSDYIADIYYKSQLVAYFSKADTVIQNPFVAVKDKVMRLINDTAQNTAVKAGICRDCPYTDANEKLPNGSYKLSEYNGVTLACKQQRDEERANEMDYIQRFKDEGATVEELTDEEVAAFKAAVQPVYDKWREKVGDEMMDRWLATVPQ